MDWNRGRGTFDGMPAADHPRHNLRQATRFTTCENRGTLDRGISPVHVRALTRDPEPPLAGPVKRPLPRSGAGAYLQRDDPASPDAGSPPTDAGTAPTDATPPDAGLPPADAGGAPAGPETGDRGAESRGTDRRGVGDDQQDVAGSLVTFKITWHGYFGDDLSARISVAGITKPRRGRPRLDQLHDTTVIDSNKEGRKSGERLGPAVLSVARYRLYRVRFEPLNDRYKTTLVTKKVPSTVSEVPVDEPLAINREHEKNVADSWDWRKIDPVQARRKSKVLLFGRPVTVHDYVLPRIAITNLIFDSMPAAVQRRIFDSIYRLGGDNERTTTLGGFSNHSIGVAFDINDNDATKQNDHFFKNNTDLLTEVVEPIARIDRRFADFAIFRDKGLTQLGASQAFIERFPIYVAALLNRTQDVADLERHTKEMAALRGSTRAAYHTFLRDQIVKDLSSKANRAKFELIATKEKKQKKSDLKKRLNLILTHWDILFKWVLGAPVKDKVTKQRKRAVGMIPLHPLLLEIMLAAGWSWGGDWVKTKDYMHFEDPDVQKQLKRPSPKKRARNNRPASATS